MCLIDGEWRCTVTISSKQTLYIQGFQSYTVHLCLTIQAIICTKDKYIRASKTNMLIRYKVFLHSQCVAASVNVRNCINMRRGVVGKEHEAYFPRINTPCKTNVRVARNSNLYCENGILSISGSAVREQRAESSATGESWQLQPALTASMPKRFEFSDSRNSDASHWINVGRTQSYLS